MNEPSSAQSNLKQLFDQFKFHLIYKNKPKATQGPACEQLKNILSELKKDCSQKRKKKKNIADILHNWEQQARRRPSSTLQSRIWKPKKIDPNSLQAVSQHLLVIEQEKQSLLSQISELHNSLNSLKKNVATIKKKVQIESAKQQKYKHISYLSKSIQRSTQSSKTNNYRSYKKLIKSQEDAIGNLKKFKNTLRKDNEDSESKYLQYKQMLESQQAKRKKTDIRSSASLKMQSSNDFKIDKTFFNKLEELINLFMQKQQNFEQMKSEQTTKIRLKKIQKRYLKEERAKMHDMIDRFEQYHGLKIQSFPNLILYLYKRLNQDNQQMQNECAKHYKIKQILLEDLQKLKEKQQEIQTAQSKTSESKPSNQLNKKKRISRNSKMFIDFVVLLHNLIGKFKYLFTMALTLNIQKKNFQDLLSQMAKTYKQDSIFYQKDMEDNTVFAQYENITNLTEMESILKQYQPADDKNELLSFIFNDLRYSLMFRRSWLQQQIHQGLQYDTLLQKISNIQQRCEQTFQLKLKVYIHLLINSLKSLAMNKYEKKIIASSNVKDSLFLSIPKNNNLFILEENDDDQLIRDTRKSEQNHKFNSESSSQDPPNFQFQQNPRKIINLLQDLKNQEKKTFKPLQLQSSQVYLYDNKVILPKYAF